MDARFDEFHRLGEREIEKLKHEPASAAREIAESLIHPEPVAIKKPKRDYKALAIKPIALGISLCASGMSIYYSFKWFESKTPWLLAAVMSVTIVACLTLLPDVAILFFQRKKISSFVGGFFLSIIAAASALFSMTSTVGGLYDARSESLKEVKTEDVRVSQIKAEQATLEASRNRILESLDRYNRDEEALQKQYDTWAARAAEGETTSSNAIITQLNATRKRKDDAESRLAPIEVRLAELAASGSQTLAMRDDFYSWMSERLKMSPDSIEFMFSAFPAIFIDIIAPSMLAIVLFL